MINGLFLLTITFVVLKALGHIDWPWLWVFAPLWILLAIIGIIIIAVGGTAFIAWWKEEPWFRR